MILYMDRVYQAVRAQLPVIYDIVDRVHRYFESTATIRNPVVNTTKHYNLRPRKPVKYKV